MASDLTFQFTESIKKDLEEINNYLIKELNNFIAAKELFNKLDSILETILLFPYAGAVIKNPSITSKEVRKITINNYILFYIPDLTIKKITILRMIHKSRDLDEIIKSFNKYDLNN